MGRWVIGAQLRVVAAAVVAALLSGQGRAADTHGTWEDIRVAPAVTRVYPVLDVLPPSPGVQRVVIAQAGASGRVAPTRLDPAPLLDAVRSATDARYWREGGGPGRLSYDEGTFELIVVASPEAQDLVASVLDRLRSEAPPQVRVVTQRITGLGGKLPETLSMWLDASGRGRLLPEQVARLQSQLASQSSAAQEFAPAITISNRSATEIHWEAGTNATMSVGVAVSVSPDRRLLTTPVQIGANGQDIVRQIDSPEWVNSPLLDGGAWLLKAEMQAGQAPQLLLMQLQVLADSRTTEDAFSTPIILPPPE